MRNRIFSKMLSLTAEYLRLPEIYVEKDCWVTLALHRIFTSPLAEFVVFKDGTALAKCHVFIKRFYEDVDLVVVKDPALTANQLKQRLGVYDGRIRHKKKAITFYLEINPVY